jgi:hypothetical protein
LNTQILSPIVGLHTSQSTNFKSSTQGKDDSPHSGVFRAVLGENYNRWYRLEVDYEDQYGGNKGTFTTRFNPYLNDVFGTNLGIDDISLSDGLVIGDDSSISFYNTFKIPTINIDNVRITYEKNAPFASWKWGTNDWKDAELFSTLNNVETF